MDSFDIYFLIQGLPAASRWRITLLPPDRAMERLLKSRRPFGSLSNFVVRPEKEAKIE